MFQRATKRTARLRMALIGPAGSGKTFTALSIATALSDKVAVIDTERGSASKYSDLFTFDVMEPDVFSPRTYIDAIVDADQAGYEVLVIDSLSHAWMGRGGALEMVDNASKRNGGGNNFSAWRDVTPQHNAMVDAIIGARLHIIATLRSKMEYVQEKDERGKTVIRKVGLQPVQRDGLEYEFDVVADLDQENNLVIGKTRCSNLYGRVFHRAGADVAGVLVTWLGSGKIIDSPAAQIVRDDAAAHSAVMTRLKELRDGLKAIGGTPDTISVAAVKKETREQLIQRCDETRVQVIFHILNTASTLDAFVEEEYQAELEALEDAALIERGAAVRAMVDAQPELVEAAL